MQRRELQSCGCEHQAAKLTHAAVCLNRHCIGYALAGAADESLFQVLNMQHVASAVYPRAWARHVPCASPTRVCRLHGTSIKLPTADD
jgi:hypothetical protein